jgi:hypothetical protein
MMGIMAKTHYSGDMPRNDTGHTRRCFLLALAEFNLPYELFSGNCAIREKLPQNTAACFLAFSHFYSANFFS